MDTCKREGGGIDLFDLHCDTLLRCMTTGEPPEENGGTLDLARGRALGGRWVQCFACFPDGFTRGEAAYGQFLSMRGILLNSCQSHPDLLSLWEPGTEPERGKCTAVLAVEGGQMLAGRLENVARFAELGVRFLTIVWNGDNELASGALDGRRRGLTAFGRDCLAEMERVGIVPDISHLNDQGVADVFALAEGPVAATHSNLRSVHGHPRNLTDEQFRFLASHGGLVGLNYHTEFVNGGEDYSPDALRRHLDRMLELGGGEAVALGSDFDGAHMPSFIGDIKGLYTLHSSVVKWYGEAVAHRVFYQNAADFLKRVSLGFQRDASLWWGARGETPWLPGRKDGKYEV